MIDFSKISNKKVSDEAKDCFSSTAMEHFSYSHNKVDVLDQYKDLHRSYQHDTTRPVHIMSSSNTFSFSQERPHPDISLVICDAQLAESFKCSFAVEGEYALFLTVLSGDAECSIPKMLHGVSNKEKKLSVSSSDTIGKFGDCAGICEVSAREPLRYVGLVMQRQSFCNLFEQENLGNLVSKFPSSERGISLIDVNPGSAAAIKLITLQILTCQMSGISRRLFMESKCLELLAHHIDRLQGRLGESQRLTATNIEMLHEAKRIMLSNMASPPTIRALARLCGTNEFKLKREYKYYFGETIFETLRKERLALARQLLLEGDYPIGYIADMIGYDSLSHFVSLFKRVYGVTPGNLRKH